MSYDIVVTSAPIPREDAEVWEGLDALLDHQGPVESRMDAFYGDLVAVYPSADTYDGDEADDVSPWATAPLRQEFDADRAHIPIRYSFADDAVPVIVDLAHRHGLAVLDLSAKQIHRGDGYRGFRLDLESGPYLIAPREDQVRDAVRSLSPEGDGAFLLVTAPGGNYAQVAGGRGEYVFERRDYGEGMFRHWAAGHGNPGASELHRVQTRGAHVEVRTNEVLSAEEACRLLLEFIQDRDLSPDFAWRDMTAEFPQSGD